MLCVGNHSDPLANLLGYVKAGGRFERRREGNKWRGGSRGEVREGGGREEGGG